MILRKYNFFIILLLFLTIKIFSNPYIDDINKIIKNPITNGAIDANMGTELKRSYTNLLPFDLKDFSIFAELMGFVNYNNNLEDFINNALQFLQ